MIVKISAKCSDLIDLRFDDGREVEGRNLSCLGGSDYVRLQIDLATGQIVGWKPPTEEQINDFIEGE